MSLAPMYRRGGDAVDIPQADSLAVRELVQSVKFGAVDVARLQRVMTCKARWLPFTRPESRVVG